MHPGRRGAGQRNAHETAAFLLEPPHRPHLTHRRARPGAHRFHAYVQWIPGSKIGPGDRLRRERHLDLTAADLSSYRGLMGGDGVTVVGMVRRPTRRDDNAALEPAFDGITFPRNVPSDSYVPLPRTIAA